MQRSVSGVALLEPNLLKRATHYILSSEKGGGTQASHYMGLARRRVNSDAQRSPQFV